jgi:hypothetical protein
LRLIRTPDGETLLDDAGEGCKNEHGDRRDEAATQSQFLAGNR